MAIIIVSKRNLMRRLCISERELLALIPSIGTALEGVSGDEMSVEIFPNRPDMLSEAGLTRALLAFTGKKIGLKKYAVKKAGYKVKVEKTRPIWPFVACAVVKGLHFSDERIKDVIQVQEKLALTMCRNRKKGGIGIYPLDKIHFPVRFTTLPADTISFQPLEFSRKLSGRQIVEVHPTGKKYGGIIEKENEFPVFIDAKGNIMSMPPIINSHIVGKINEETKDVFIEATGPDLETLQIAVTIIATMLADMGGQLFSIDISYKNKILTTPDLSPRQILVEREYINKRLGLDLKESDLKKLLGRMGLGYVKGKVLIPSYRNDIMHQVDICEDVAIAYGYDNFKGVIPNVATIGHEAPFEVFKDKVRDVLVGAGLLEVKNYALENETIQNTRMNTKDDLVEIENSLSEGRSHMRRAILPSLMRVLEENKHHEYPQNLFEIGTVFSFDKTRETGVKEEDKLGVVLAGRDVDFTKIKQIVVGICRAFDLPAETRTGAHPSFIPGRIAKISVKGKVIGIVGEMSPEVISACSLAHPVSACELDLVELFILLR